jgi:hypothetical protein
MPNYAFIAVILIAIMYFHVDFSLTQIVVTPMKVMETNRISTLNVKSLVFLILVS